MPCQLCPVLYRRAAGRDRPCAECGGTHRVCVVCAERWGLVPAGSQMRHTDPLAGCPDAVTLARELMGEERWGRARKTTRRRRRPQAMVRR